MKIQQRTTQLGNVVPTFTTHHMYPRPVIVVVQSIAGIQDRTTICIDVNVLCDVLLVSDGGPAATVTQGVKQSNCKEEEEDKKRKAWMRCNENE